MKTNRLKRNGFTLIELMIIVTIIGILAAIVIPTFSNANETAKAGALASQLNTVKKSLVMYNTDHNGVYPADTQLIANQWQVLTTTTDIDGDVAGEDYGPYFQKPPFNAFKDSSIVAADNSAAWQYTSSTGTIQAVVPSAITTPLVRCNWIKTISWLPGLGPRPNLLRERSTAGTARVR